MRSVLHRLEAASIGVILALILAELGLRAFRLAPTGGIVSVTSEQYRRIPGIFAPNQRALDQRKPELAFWVTIDSLGYRGADFPRVKPRGEFRVFVAGDSFVYGDFVEDAETFPAWLARFLSSRCENVRVINGGLGGATIVDESPMIDRATALDLDLILLVFTENDVTDLAGTPMWARLAENRRAKSRFPLSVAYPLLRRTALWNFGLQVEGAMRAAREPAYAGQGAPPTANSPIPRLRESYERAFVPLRDTLRARRQGFGFAVFPAHFSVAGSGIVEQLQWAKGLAARTGVPSYDLLPPLRAAGLPTTRLYLMPHDGHPSSLGYAIAAKFLVERLLERPPLIGHCRHQERRRGP